jgi:hypothetical protein
MSRARRQRPRQGLGLKIRESGAPVTGKGEQTIQ